MFLLLSFVYLQISLADFCSQCKMKVLFFGPASAGMFCGRGQAGIWKGCCSYFRALSTFVSAVVLTCQCLSRSRLPPLFAAGRSCAELGREPSFGHLSFLQRVFTILCCLRHYATFCWTQDTKKESVSFWILSLLTYWNPSSNPFSPWAPGFPTEPCVHHRPSSRASHLSPASAPLAPASFVAQEPLVPSPVSAADNQRLYSQTLGFEVWFFLPAAPSSWAFRLSEPSFALLWNESLAVLARWI